MSYVNELTGNLDKTGESDRINIPAVDKGLCVMPLKDNLYLLGNCIFLSFRHENRNKNDGDTICTNVRPKY